MNLKNAGWWTVVVLGITVLWVISAYSTLFTKREAWIVDGATGSVYRLTLLPGRNPYDPWEYLMPSGVKDTQFTDIVSVEFETTLAKLVEERNLRETDLNEWLRRMKRDVESSGRDALALRRNPQKRSVESVLSELVWSEGAYIPRVDLKPRAVLPAEWQWLADPDDGRVLPIDFVLAT